MNGMSQKVGRNDPCPCGSGKKYKKCCIEDNAASVWSSDVVDFHWRQIRQLEGSVIDRHLIPYVDQELPGDIRQEALEEFYPEELPEEMNQQLLLHCLFLPWFLFNWVPFDDFNLRNFDGDKTIAENYLKYHANLLSSQERRFVEAMNKTHYSLYQVLDVEREKFLVVKDSLLGTTHKIKERQGTHYIKRGDILFSRILTLDESSIFVGMAPFVIPSKLNLDLIDFRKWLIGENADSPLTPMDLREKFDWQLLSYFFNAMNDVFNKPYPTLMNTDGELVEFSKSFFKLDMSPEEAFKRLFPLTLSKDKLEDILDDAEKDKTGNITKIEFSWLGKGNKMNKLWDNTILGDIVIETGRLILETNSRQRSDYGKKILKEYLGESLSFQQTLIETTEQKRQSSKQSASEEDQYVGDTPEEQEMIQEAIDMHWKNWFDLVIPSLGEKSPREAAKTQEGREKLDALFLYYERSNLLHKDNIFKADISYLRRELNLAP